MSLATLRMCALGLACAVVARPGLAKASEPPREYVAPEEQTRFSLNADWWPGIDANVGALSLDADVRVVRNLVLQLDVPWAIGTVRRLADSPGVIAGSGNVGVGLLVIGNARPYAVLWGGLSAGIPTVYGTGSVADFDRSTLATFAAFARDGYDFQRYLPEESYARLSFGFDLLFGGPIRFRGEAVLVVTIPVGADTRGVASASMAELEHRIELEGRASFGFILGVGAQVIAGNSTWSFDGGNFGIGPYIGYEPAGRGVFARLGYMVGTALLNSPFDRSGFQSVAFTLGYRL